MKFNVKHISLRSAFKVGCLMSALYIFIPILFLCSLTFGLIPQRYGYGLGTIVTLLPALILGAIVWGIGPGLILTFHALLYNIVARYFGGFVVTLEGRGESIAELDVQKPKRTSIDDIERQIRARRAKIAP